MVLAKLALASVRTRSSEGQFGASYLNDDDTERSKQTDYEKTRYTGNGTAITSLRIATSEQWTDKQSGERQERTEWHRVKLFGKLAEIAGEYLKKGRQVYIEGSLRTDKYTDKDGVERFSTDIIAAEMQMLGGGSEGGAAGGGGGNFQRAQGGGGGQRQGGYSGGGGGQARGGDNYGGGSRGGDNYGNQQQRQSAPPVQNNSFDDDDIPF